jgi:branched-chain amino acid transport system permease protein
MTQILVNGLAQGLLLAVVALAFALVYATTRVFYLALGATYTLAPYIFLEGLRMGLPWFVGVGCAILAAVALGCAAEELIHWPLERRRAPAEVHFIASLGAFLVVGQIVVLVWGNDAQVLRTGVDVVYAFAGIRVTGGQAIGAVVAVAALAGTFLWLRGTDIGLQFRAMASNSPLLATLGHDIRRLRWAVFGLSGALAALVALATARDVGFDPNVGMRTVLVGVAATIIGGRGSFVGSAVAGLLLGVLRAQVVWYTSARWEDAITFLLLAGFLLLVPGGLRSLATGRVMRVEDAR